MSGNGRLFIQNELDEEKRYASGERMQEKRAQQLKFEQDFLLLYLIISFKHVSKMHSHLMEMLLFS